MMKHNQYSTADSKTKSFYSIYGSFQRFEKTTKLQNLPYFSIFWPNTCMKQVCLTPNGKKQIRHSQKTSKKITFHITYLQKLAKLAPKMNQFSIQFNKNVGFLNFLFQYTHQIMSARFLMARKRFGLTKNQKECTYMSM